MQTKGYTTRVCSQHRHAHAETCGFAFFSFPALSLPGCCVCRRATSCTWTLCDPDSLRSLSINSWPVKQELIVGSYSHSAYHAGKINLLWNKKKKETGLGLHAPLLCVWITLNGHMGSVTLWTGFLRVGVLCVYDGFHLWECRKHV